MSSNKAVELLEFILLSTLDQYSVHKWVSEELERSSGAPGWLTAGALIDMVQNATGEEAVYDEGTLTEVYCVPHDQRSPTIEYRTLLKKVDKYYMPNGSRYVYGTVFENKVDAIKQVTDEHVKQLDRLAESVKALTNEIAKQNAMLKSVEGLGIRIVDLTTGETVVVRGGDQDE